MFLTEFFLARRSSYGRQILPLIVGALAAVMKGLDDHIGARQPADDSIVATLQRFFQNGASGHRQRSGREIRPPASA